MSIEQKVNKILLDNLEISEADIKPDISLRNELGATSVDLVEILAALESEFDIEISDEQSQSLPHAGRHC